METYTLPYVKQIASGNLLYDAGSSDELLCDNLEGWEVQEGGTYIYPWLTQVNVWQRPTQYCKAIIFQLKINKLKYILSCRTER